MQAEFARPLLLYVNTTLIENLLSEFYLMLSSSLNKPFSFPPQIAFALCGKFFLFPATSHKTVIFDLNHLGN